MDSVDKRFALDTNLMRQPTSRRLLHGIALETDNKIVILPEVHRELRHGKQEIARAEIRRVTQRHRRKHMRLSSEQQRDVDEVVTRVALAWYDDELTRTDSPFERLSVSDADTKKVIEIAENIPKEVFRESWNPYDPKGDPLIVAQTIFFNIELLGSNNLSTIDHDKLNGWLLSKGFNRPLIQSPSETIDRLSEEQSKDRSAYKWCMSHVMNRYFDHEQGNREEFLKGLARLNASGFKEHDPRRSVGFETIVFRVRAHFRSDREFQQTLEQTIRETRHVRERALGMELSLDKAVYDAVALVVDKSLNHTLKEGSSRDFGR